MRRKIVPDHLAILHYESNSLQFADVGDRISSNGDKIGKLARLTRAFSPPETRREYYLNSSGERVLRAEIRRLRQLVDVARTTLGKLDKEGV